MPSSIVSNSQLRTFKRCRRKYWLAYVRKLKTRQREVTGARALGTRVHHALEAYYDIEGVVGREAALAALNELRDRELETAGDDPLLVESVEKEHQLAVTMIEGYCDWVAENGEDANLEVVAREQLIRVPSPVDEVELIGKLDLIVRNRETGDEGFMDHKTVGDLQTPLKTLGMDEQFRQYALMQRAKATAENGSPVRFQIYNMLKKSKRTARANPPFFARYEVYVSDDELRLFWQRLWGELLDLLALEQRLEEHPENHHAVAYPTPTRDCSWDCDFYAVCPLFDDPHADPEYLLQANYVTGDPHAHYDGQLTTSDDQAQ